VNTPVNLVTAFLAGLLSFLSPCVLPLVPSYLSFLTGRSVTDLKAETTREARVTVMLHALAFVSGFTVIFMLIGLSASAIGGAFATHKELIGRIGGIIIIILGLNMLGVLRFRFLAMDTRAHKQYQNQSFAVSFLVGIGFAGGWSPCIGPILSGIILLASQDRIPQAVALLFAYAMGLAVPFLLTAAAITQALGALNRIKRFLPTIERTSGAVLVATGLVLAFNAFDRVTGVFYQFVKPPSL